MSARSKSRKRALDLLFSADVRGDALADALARETTRALAMPERATTWPYARQIVQGVIDNRDEIDGLLDRLSAAWPLDRMPAVDRAVLRMAAWEILHNPEVPASVAIDEAVELAKQLSTDDSPRFVNGLLGAIVDEQARSGAA